MGSIHCDKVNYDCLETMHVYLDLLNHGQGVPVDLYIDLKIEDTRFYWPYFGLTPHPLAVFLPAGFSLSGYEFLSLQVPVITGHLICNWELWVFARGSTSLDDVYTYHRYLVRINV